MDQDLSNCSKEELLKKIAELEDDLKRTKKYGLVWDKEKNPEAVVEACKTKIPVLNEDSSKRIILGKNDNILIEGDNFHSLTALDFILKGSIDVIYIDPPYNTGSKDFKYNDRFVNDDDGFYHSKWLNFMQKRLQLANQLLKEDGVILISIDEHEHSDLCLLCDGIFGQKIGEVIRKTKTVTADSKTSFNLQHEYCVIYAKKNSKILFKGKEKSYNEYTNKDNDVNGPWVSADPSAKSGGTSTYFPIENPYTKQIDFPPKGRYWAFSKSTFDDYVKSGRVVFKKEKKKGQRGFLFKRYQVGQKNVFSTLDSLAFDNNDYINQVGTKEAKFYGFENNFKYPKPTCFIESLLSYCTSKDSVVLDFFAGSGTTGEAVLRLNNEDGGRRKFILCTNNENGICENITYNRLKSVLYGRPKNNSKDSDGINENLFYFKTDFVNDSKNRDQAKYSLVEKCNGLLSILEDCFILKDKTTNYFEYSDCGDKRMFIYNDFYSKKPFDEMKEKIKKETGKKILYIFSTDDDLSPFDLSDLTDVEVKPIPTKIYEIYKEIVEDIKRGE